MLQCSKQCLLSSAGTVVLFVILQSLQIPMTSTEDLHGEFFKERSRNLALPIGERDKFAWKSFMKDVPTAFFKQHRDEQIRGNGSRVYFHKIATCWPGYKPYKYDSNRCVPECDNQCINGFCVAPNECKCFDGFVANASNVCTFTCPLGCQNGRCYLNGTCACYEGYTLDPSGLFCNAKCKEECGQNQLCVQPDVCGCREGYKMTDSGCQPICTPDCGYGKCVAPNKCECHEGYSRKNNVCQVHCYMRCENGYCESSEKCVCRVGYRYDNQTTDCLPECGADCQNGVCIAPGECKCYKGYARKGVTCEPICPKGCGYYGVCVEPNICGCGANRLKCNDGYCDAHGKCNCNEGLTRFIDRCIDPLDLNSTVANFQERLILSNELKHEFEKVIGDRFKI